MERGYREYEVELDELRRRKRDEEDVLGPMWYAFQEEREANIKRLQETPSYKRSKLIKSNAEREQGIRERMEEAERQHAYFRIHPDGKRYEETDKLFVARKKAIRDAANFAKRVKEYKDFKQGKPVSPVYLGTLAHGDYAVQRFRDGPKRRELEIYRNMVYNPPYDYGRSRSQQPPVPFSALPRYTGGFLPPPGYTGGFVPPPVAGRSFNFPGSQQNPNERRVNTDDLSDLFRRGASVSQPTVPFSAPPGYTGGFVPPPVVGRSFNFPGSQQNPNERRVNTDDLSDLFRRGASVSQPSFVIPRLQPPPQQGRPRPTRNPPERIIPPQGQPSWLSGVISKDEDEDEDEEWLFGKRKSRRLFGKRKSHR